MSWTTRLAAAVARLLPHRASADEPGSLPIPAERLEALQQRLGYRIRSLRVFAQALQHRSYSQRSHDPSRSNERLEFLGDSVLNLIVGDYLFRRYPRAEEGDLTKLRSRLVNKKALAAYARELGLSDLILMSPSAAQAGGKGHATIAADTFEAIIAAIYLDGGFPQAQAFVQRQVLSAIERGSVITEDENYKSKLLEYAQSHGLGIPRYMIVSEEGPDHDRTFTVEVQLGSVRRGTGTGKNKKEAEQAAASQALEYLTAHGHARI